MGHDLADCPALVRTADPYGTGDHWYVHVEHGCSGYIGVSGYGESVYKNA